MAKERKTDRRTLYTRQVIMDSYISLLEQMPREKIKVTEICRLAEINRCTFYLHFQDVLEVEQAIEDQIAEKFMSFIATQTANNKNQMMVSNLFVQQMIKDKTYQTLRRLGNKEPPLMKPMQYYYEQQAFTESLEQECPKVILTDRQKKMLFTFLAGGTSAVEMEWINEGLLDIAEDNMFLDQMVRTLIREINKRG